MYSRLASIDFFFIIIIMKIRQLKIHIQGYNGTILCYGQTGSGKTHTLFGSGISEGVNRGLVPRVLEFLWQNIVRESHRTSGTLSFSCKCSFYEIYQEKVFDLLDIAGAAQSSGLNVREDSKTGDEMLFNLFLSFFLIFVSFRCIYRRLV